MVLPKLFIASMFIVGAAAPVLAQQTPVPSHSHTCAALQDMVQQKGRVMISRGPNLFAAYVNNCAPRDIPVPEYVPARDNGQCFIGYSCR